MTVLVAADFSAEEWAQWWPLLRQALPGESLVRGEGDGLRDDIEIAIVANPAPGALAGLPRLRLIQSLWAGVDRLLADPSVPVHVPLARMVDPAMNESMAHTALWAVLSLHRRFFAYAAQQRAAAWRPHAPCRADELTVAVLGLGQMGAGTARCLASQGYRVLGWSRGELRPFDGVVVHAGDDALPRVLAQAQIVVNLLPLTPLTRGLFNAERLACLPRSASLVNLARGAHVVESDLLAALSSGQLQHAVLDVFDTEPLPPAHPFWRHPAITVLPHVAAPTDARSAVGIAASNIHALRAGRPLQHRVDRARGY